MPRDLVVGETYSLDELSAMFGVTITEESRIVVPDMVVPEVSMSGYKLRLSIPTFHVTWDDSITFEGRLAVNPDGTLERWNGWVVPYFDRAQAQRYIDYAGTDEARAYDEYLETGRWHEQVPDVLMMYDPQYPNAGEYALRALGRQKLYGIGARIWTWYITSPSTDPEMTPVEWEEVQL